MNTKFRDRRLLGAGAAACAVCCAPPVLALVGIAGAGLTAAVATAVFAGLAFGLVVLAASLLGLWARHRRACNTGHAQRPADVTIGARPPDAGQDHTGGGRSY